MYCWYEKKRTCASSYVGVWNRSFWLHKTKLKLLQINNLSYFHQKSTYMLTTYLLTIGISTWNTEEISQVRVPYAYFRNTYLGSTEYSSNTYMLYIYYNLAYHIATIFNIVYTENRIKGFSATNNNLANYLLSFSI